MFQLYATALNIAGDSISYRPLKIGYTGREKRRTKSYLDDLLENVNSQLESSADEADVEGQVSYIAMEYIRFFTENIRNRNYEDTEVLAELNSLHTQISAGSELAGRVSRVLAAKLTAMISR